MHGYLTLCYVLSNHRDVAYGMCDVTTVDKATQCDTVLSTAKKVLYGLHYGEYMFFLSTHR